MLPRNHAAKVKALLTILKEIIKEYLLVSTFPYYQKFM
jgi:hypothetical protein